MFNHFHQGRKIMQKGIKTLDIDRMGKHEEIFPPHSYRKDIEKFCEKVQN